MIDKAGSLPHAFAGAGFEEITENPEVRMKLHFDMETVTTTYHYAEKDDYSPTKQKLTEWDGNLYKAYNDLLNAMLPLYKIRNTRANRSKILLLAEISRTRLARKKVDNACRFYIAVKNM